MSRADAEPLPRRLSIESLARPAARSGELPGRIAYAAVGDGPPLVVFPGMSRAPIDPPGAERAAAPYRALAQAAGRTVHVLHRPRGMRRGTTMAEIAHASADALHALFAAPVDVLGISTGGAVALQLAVDHPSAVRRLVVAAAASWLGERGRRRLRAYGERVERGGTGAWELASVLAPPLLRPAAAAVLWVSSLRERAADPGDLLATIDAEVGFNVTDLLDRVTAPTLVIGGARDRAFSPALFRATADGIPGARLILYPRSGHVGTMLNPRFGRDVAAFLAEP